MKLQVKKGDLVRWCITCHVFVSEAHKPHPSVWHSKAMMDSTVEVTA